MPRGRDASLDFVAAGIPATRLLDQRGLVELFYTFFKVFRGCELGRGIVRVTQKMPEMVRGPVKTRACRGEREGQDATIGTPRATTPTHETLAEVTLWLT